MPTPPTIALGDNSIIGNIPYVTTGQVGVSSWGKQRCPLIVGHLSFSVGDNSLVVDEGFHPDDGLHVRVERWPYVAVWVDGSTNNITGYYGPILGFTDVVSTVYISLGGYDVPDYLGFNSTNGYSPYENNLDENDCAGFFVGREVNGTYTTTDDFCNSDRSVNTSSNGQDIGPVSFSGYSTVSDMTAF